jgi:isopenicillin-N epimerase
LWEQWRIDVPIVPWAGQLWVRISAQIYNTPADYERLATAVEAM